MNRIKGSTTNKDLELELRIGRLEAILGSVIEANGDTPLQRLWADTKGDVLRVFPESRV